MDISVNFSLPFAGRSPSGHQGFRCGLFSVQLFRWGLWEPLGVTLPAGSTTFPLKLLPDHQNWHFLMFLNDGINHLLFLFALSETFGEAF